MKNQKFHLSNMNYFVCLVYCIDFIIPKYLMFIVQADTDT